MLERRVADLEKRVAMIERGLDLLGKRVAMF
jgi:hypothetical protein